MTGRELAEQLTRDRSDFPVVLMAGHLDTPKVIGSAAADILVKPVSVESLQAAIKRATDGEVVTDAELERTFKKLTGREREIAALVVAGKSSREIAAALDVSTKTVEAHRSRILAKTRADDVGHLVRLWRAWKR
jgi:two-component system response regulator FixJ